MHIFPEFSKLNLRMGAFLLGYNSSVAGEGILFYITISFSINRMIFLSAIRVLMCYKAVVLNQDKEWRESCPPGDIWKCVETFLVVGSGLLLVSSAKRSGRLVNTLWSKWYHKELSSRRCQ